MKTVNNFLSDFNLAGKIAVLISVAFVALTWLFLAAHLIVTVLLLISY